MATAISPTAGRRYGVARVCEVWDLPRSSFYAARQQQVDAAAAPPPAQRRGPKPAVSTRPCWRRSVPISPARHGPAKAIARSGPGCA